MTITTSNGTTVAIKALTERAEAAEADAVTLRAKVAAVEALADRWRKGWGYEDDSTLATQVCGDQICAALATTGEGQHVAREVFTADGIPFVRCSCTNAKSPTSSRWLTEHVPNGGLAELQAVIKRQGEGAKA